MSEIARWTEAQLDRMVREGLLEVRVGPGVKQYRLTPAGRLKVALMEDGETRH